MASYQATAEVFMTAFKALPGKERDAFLALAGGGTGEYNWDLIKIAMETVCNVSMIPAQDLLGLGSVARMNVPGVNEGNWQWRLKEGALSASIAARLGLLAKSTGRAVQ